MKCLVLASKLSVIVSPLTSVAVVALRVRSLSAVAHQSATPSGEPSGDIITLESRSVPKGKAKSRQGTPALACGGFLISSADLRERCQESVWHAAGPISVTAFLQQSTGEKQIDEQEDESQCEEGLSEMLGDLSLFDSDDMKGKTDQQQSSPVTTATSGTTPKGELDRFCLEDTSDGDDGMEELPPAALPVASNDTPTSAQLVPSAAVPMDDDAASCLDERTVKRLQQEHTAMFATRLNNNEDASPVSWIPRHKKEEITAILQTWKHVQSDDLLDRLMREWKDVEKKLLQFDAPFYALMVSLLAEYVYEEEPISASMLEVLENLTKGTDAMASHSDADDEDHSDDELGSSSSEEEWDIFQEILNPWCWGGRAEQRLLIGPFQDACNSIDFYIFFTEYFLRVAKMRLLEDAKGRGKQLRLKCKVV
ncbi:unnamed protein product [Amoebophrya sp. A25]|nr:unnamed protein product [Amoebophrya sp. A25]|eukprot:GSA25T00001940001.1